MILQRTRPPAISTLDSAGVLAVSEVPGNCLSPYARNRQRKRRFPTLRGVGRQDNRRTDDADIVVDLAGLKQGDAAYVELAAQACVIELKR
jgi:hypothetical protein